MKPNTVLQAEVGIWMMTAVAAVVTLIDKWMGVYTAVEFWGAVVFLAIVCIIPYKIGQRRNWARVIYTITSVAGFLLMLGGDIDIPRLDFVAGLLTAPAEIYVIVLLFRKESRDWFAGTAETPHGVGDDAE